MTVASLSAQVSADPVFIRLTLSVWMAMSNVAIVFESLGSFVLEGLTGRIEAVVDGGACPVL